MKLELEARKLEARKLEKTKKAPTPPRRDGLDDIKARLVKEIAIALATTELEKAVSVREDDMHVNAWDEVYE